ncbi:MAG: hypothetical protein GX205_11450 [Firmicutes bacterium]|jgi:hypothetical protein|nr:hypothetical protein [Bacillota bacterium]
MVRMLKLTSAILLAVFMAISANAAIVGEEIELGNGKQFRQPLVLEPGQKYSVSISVQSAQPNAQVTLTVEFADDGGTVKEYISTQRGLGGEGRWTVVGLEFTTPDSPRQAQLVLTADQPGTYRWDSLAVQKLHETVNEVQQYWEERFAKHGAVYTGLVVDARHLDVRRGISPRVYSESGQLLYGGVLASAEFVQDVGVVAYGRELDPDLIKRIQVDPEYAYARPLIVEAVGVVDPARTGVYVSEADAERILQALSQYDFFARYAVIFLIN